MILLILSIVKILLMKLLILLLGEKKVMKVIGIQL